MFFSIVIPSCGRMGMLKRAIASLDAQTYKNFEIVIVDDMKESSLNMADFDYKHLNITVVKNTGAHGVSRARNLGIASAKGQWICFLDDDDEFCSDYLNTLQKNIEDDSTTDLYWCGVQLKLNPQESQQAIVDLLFYENTDVFKIGISYGVAVKASVLGRYGYFNDDFFVAEDTELIFRLLDKKIIAKPIKMIGVIKDETHTNRLSSGYKIYSDTRVYERLFAMYHDFLLKHKKIYLDLFRWSIYVHFINRNYYFSIQMFIKMLKTLLMMPLKK